MTGMIDRIVRGKRYGYLRFRSKDLFFHASQASAFDTLHKGQLVTFQLQADLAATGKWRAVCVCVVANSGPTVSA